MTSAAKIEVDDKILTMGRWDAEEVEIEDDGLVRYVSLDNILAPRSRGRHEEKQFYKADVPITERLLNRMYVAGHRGKKHYIDSGHNTGDSEKIWNIIEDAYDIIENETGENPIQVLVNGIENSAPTEEVVTYQRGGVRARKAVIVAPQRRVDLALRLIIQGAYEKRRNDSDSAAETLANEIILCANGNDDARAVREKERREREAEGAR
ncbi:MAG: 30S ribosomal protein S7 [Nanohaloarchaea archaeon SW_4_43_9]|nr:MAG: 30S ribosomal protein S7 [Nanohaloarchaea archaeon SW_4_43_9]